MICAYKQPMWILETVKGAQSREFRMLSTAEGQAGDFWNRCYMLDTR